MTHMTGAPCRHCWHRLDDHVEGKCLFASSYYEEVTADEVVEAVEIHQSRDFLSPVHAVELSWFPVLISGWDYYITFVNGGTTRGFLEQRMLVDIVETRRRDG